MRRTMLLLVLMCLIAALPASAAAMEEGRVGDVLVERLAGASRIDTAVEISRAAYDQAGTVLLARADDPADALGGAALAGAVEGPVLLSPSDRLPEQVRSEIDRLGATTVLLLGGEAALGPAVEDALAGLQVERVAGPNRFATAVAIARRLPTGRAYVVRGSATDPDAAWPDALAVGPEAASSRQPILPVERDNVPAEVRELLGEGGYDDLTIVGGPAAVSTAVEEQLRVAVGTVDRVAGATRYETTAMLYRQHGPETEDVRWLATGAAFADALVAAPAIARTAGHLVLVDGRDLAGQEAALHLLRRDVFSLDRVILLGGPSAIEADALVELEEALLQDDLDAPRCTVEQLVAAPVSVFAFEGGNPALYFEFVNRSEEVCTLQGRPGLDWLDTDGAPLPTPDGPQERGEGEPLNSGPAPVVPLAARGDLPRSEYGQPGAASLYVDRFVYGSCAQPDREGLLRARLTLPDGGVLDTLTDPPVEPFSSEGCVQVGRFGVGDVRGDRYSRFG